MPWTYISEVDAFSIYHQIREEQRGDDIVDDGSFLPSLGHAIAGSIGTAISNLAVYPLDLVVTRLQVQQRSPSRDVRPNEKGDGKEANRAAEKRHDGSLLEAVRHIYHTEGGIPAFYSGITQDTLKSMTDSFLFFLFYNLLLLRLRRRVVAPSPAMTGDGSGKGNATTDATRLATSLSHAFSSVGIGMIAGAATKAITSPLQQVITRKQTNTSITQNDSTTAILKHIYRTRGFRGFWAGYSASLVLTLNPSLTMAFHSTLEKTLQRAKRKDGGGDSHADAVGPTLTFLLAATSKAAASCVMYPVSLAKTRAQVASASAAEASPQAPSEQSSRRKSGGSVLLTVPGIARTEGVGALYAGLSGEMAKGFLSHGLTMVVKQRIQGSVVWLWFVLSAWMRKTNG